MPKGWPPLLEPPKQLLLGLGNVAPKATRTPEGAFGERPSFDEIVTVAHGDQMGHLVPDGELGQGRPSPDGVKEAEAGHGLALPGLTWSRSRTVSAKPTVCMATPTALAKAKMRPMEPPNSGPRLREMRK